jgi:hypothetical protein
MNEVKTKQLKHLYHLEELVFFQGVKGAKKTIEIFEQGIEDIGKHKTNLKTTSKIDGAPSTTAGWDPESGKFFVGTKSLFNKEPKINFTNEDIDRNHGHAPGLAKKLKLALEYLPGVIKKGKIVAGDFMYDTDDLKTETIDGTKVISFKPNTITYAVDASSDLAKEIKQSKIGIIFHSSYTGETIESMAVNFSVNDSMFKKSKDVYFRTVDMSLDEISWSDEEYAKLNKDIFTLKKTLNKMDHDQINAIADNPKLSQTIMTYINSKVRAGKRFNKNEIGNLIDYVAGKFDKEKFKLKSDKGKNRKEDQKQEFINTLREYASTLYGLFQWSYAAEDIKNIFVDKLEEIEQPEMSYQLNQNGQYTKVGPEGFVVSDSPDSSVKFVNRAVFSRNNFNNAVY